MQRSKAIPPTGARPAPPPPAPPPTPPRRAAAPPREALPWRAAVFLAVFALFWAGWEAMRGQPLERFVVERVVVASAAAVIHRLDPGLGAEADGERIAAPGGGLRVRGGCEGVDVALLLAAAFAAAPLRWGWRAIGLAGGLAIVFVLNQGRLVWLFHAHRSGDLAWFDALHGWVTPLGLVAAAGAWFGLVLRRAGRRGATENASP